MNATMVKEELMKAGSEFAADKYGKNTIVAAINPHIMRFTIGIRADMDVLPILEKTMINLSIRHVSICMPAAMMW